MKITVFFESNNEQSTSFECLSALPTNMTLYCSNMSATSMMEAAQVFQNSGNKLKINTASHSRNL